MMNDAAAVERLSIPKYNCWNECPHGVARCGVWGAKGLTL